MGFGISCLDHEQSIVLNYPTSKSVEHGPKIKPYCCATAEIVRKTRLTEKEYVRIFHKIPDEGQIKSEIFEGPGLYELQSPFDQVSGPTPKISLVRDTFIRVTDRLTGERKIIEGPALYTPAPYENCSPIEKKYNMSSTQYILIRNEETGERTVRHGPSLYTPGPFEYCSNILDMPILNENSYIYVTHQVTGVRNIVEGPLAFCPGPFDIVSPIYPKISLSIGEYVTIVDQNTGVLRVEKGPVTIVLKQYEKLVHNKKRAIEVNDEQAVYILNIDSGNHDLITEHGMFIPSATQQIIETRKKIRLEPHEEVVVVDRNGQYAVMKGSDETRAFFIPPYCHLLEQNWSSNAKKDGTQTQKVVRFDLRPQYMDFEFLIRTKDNVELILNLNFYWQIFDVEKMITSSKDAPEDICKHAMSKILSEISKKDVKEFMESFNEIIQGAVKGDGKFYSNRGIHILRVEVTGRRCRDEETEKVFRQIIKEKINTMKNAEKKDGENEIRILDLEGKIIAEELNGKIVNVKKSYLRNEAQTDGEAEAARVANFVETLPEIMSVDQKLDVYYDRQNTQRMLTITSQNQTTLYVTPEDLNFKLATVNVIHKNVDKKKKLLK